MARLARTIRPFKAHSTISKSWHGRSPRRPVCESLDLIGAASQSSDAKPLFIPRQLRILYEDRFDGFARGKKIQNERHPDPCSPHARFPMTDSRIDADAFLPVHSDLSRPCCLARSVAGSDLRVHRRVLVSLWARWLRWNSSRTHRNQVGRASRQSRQSYRHGTFEQSSEPLASPTLMSPSDSKQTLTGVSGP